MCANQHALAKFDAVIPITELRGERTGIRYAIGTRVRVQVSRVDLDGRRIDFRLVREDGEPRAPRDKGAARAGERGQPAPTPPKRAARKQRDATRPSPIQALKSAAKKAAAKAKKNGKPRKSRR